MTFLRLMQPRYREFAELSTVNYFFVGNAFTMLAPSLS